MCYITVSGDPSRPLKMRSMVFHSLSICRYFAWYIFLLNTRFAAKFVPLYIPTFSYRLFASDSERPWTVSLNSPKLSLTLRIITAGGTIMQPIGGSLFTSSDMDFGVILRMADRIFSTALFHTNRRHGILINSPVHFCDD